ncbi:MAG: hypothetical protein JXA20_04475 [Spirochaetes bacterium]|nr:hypothetical protein [Spirochaetota bacterium]
MSKGKKALIAMGIIAGIICALSFPKLGFSRLAVNVPADIGEDQLMAVVVEDFEKSQVGENNWIVKTEPKQFVKDDTEKKAKMKNPVTRLDLKVVAGGPNDMAVEEWSLTGLGKTKEKCLGLNFQFRYAGTNSVHIIPPLEVQWKEKTPVLTYNSALGRGVQEPGIELPGRSKAISMWVHGRGHPYELEVWVKDYRGDTHILKMGSVNFVGWRPMKVEIPESVPQSYASYPQTRVTKIVRIVLRAVPSAHSEELMENTYFFFDQIKVLTDTYEVNFDGNELHKAFDRGEKGSGGGTNK